MTHSSKPLQCLRFLKHRAAVLAMALGLLAATPLHAEPVSLRLDWLPSGYHAPIFLALQKGYYKDVGIELTIADGKGTNPALQSVTAGNDMIVLANYSTMIQSVATGMPLMAIGGLVQRTPDSIISLKDHPIARPEDLLGKTIVVPPDSAASKLFAAFLVAAKLDASKIKILNVNSNTVATTLLQGQADAMTGWSFTDALKVASQKPIAPPIPLSDYGVSFLGTGFVVTRETAKTKADLLKRFMSATAKGYAEGTQDPKAAIAALVAQRPLVDGALLLDQFSAFPPFIHTAASAGKPFGWTAKSDWDTTYDLLRKYFDMQQTVDVSTLYTNEFVTP